MVKSNPNLSLTSWSSIGSAVGIFVTLSSLIVGTLFWLAKLEYRSAANEKAIAEIQITLASGILPITKVLIDEHEKEIKDLRMEIRACVKSK